MKPSPLMAAVFSIILLLTFVVLLRSVVGPPEAHEASIVEEESNESSTEGVEKESGVKEDAKKPSIPQDAPAH